MLVRAQESTIVIKMKPNSGHCIAVIRPSVFMDQKMFVRIEGTSFPPSKWSCRECMVALMGRHAFSMCFFSER